MRTNGRGLPLHDITDHEDVSGVTGTGSTVVLSEAPTINDPTIRDSVSAAGAAHQVLRSTGSDVLWGDARGIINPFSGGPAGISAGLVSWFEARRESDADGATCPTITDLSAAASNWTQGTDANRPIFRSTTTATARPNGFPFWQFVDDRMVRAANITGSVLAVFLVVRKSGAGTDYDVVLNTDDHQFMSRISGVDQYNVNSQFSGETLPSTWSLLTFLIRSQTDWDMGRNGQLINYTASLGGAINYGSTGLGSDGAGSPALIDIAAGAIYTTIPSVAEVAAINSYFRGVFLV